MCLPPHRRGLTHWGQPAREDAHRCLTWSLLTCLRSSSIHEYVLKPQVEAPQSEHVLRIAQERELFHQPGLIAYHFVKGIKGQRQGRYMAIGIYESREA